ncbi:hypothetical protein P0R31_39270 [Bradyrhizobium yuanmingense]|nr:hypothetical protein [Bradyrhizobium yuanmingense]MDF0523247.1 hypothetical protein [Bradyrhizobium yuanmingense]
MISMAEPGAKAFRICVSRSMRVSASAFAGLEIGDFARQGIGAGHFLGHGKHHGLQRLYVTREAEIGRRN